MPSASSTSTQPEGWKIRKKDVKSYLHFDCHVSKVELEQYAMDDEKVARHAFFPLILFNESWTKFRKNGAKKVKIRPLRYSARKDAAIFAYHRYFLSEHYEAELQRRGISNLPVAYRKIPRSDGGGNKCNIDFAADVFDYIRTLGDCDVTVVDISGFFESLDHTILKSNWECLLGRALNSAENAVFNAVTKYTVVDRAQTFERLGLFKKTGGGNRKQRRQRDIDKIRAQKHVQLCTPSEFRAKICGGDSSLPSLLQKHSLDYGIPQGTPISDLLANLYLIDFDTRLARWVRKHGGRAYRYCDDIVVVLPTKKSKPYFLAKNYLQSSIEEFGDHLKIKEEKVSVSRFIQGHDRQYHTHIIGKSSRNGLEYLGFQFDGKTVQLRNSTLSNAWRKLKRRSYGWAKRWVRRHRAKGDAWMRANAPVEAQIEKILRRVSVREKDFRKWTFNKYVQRCSKTFADYEQNFSSQTKKYRRQSKAVIQASLKKAIKKHGYRACARNGISL